jgi:ribosomal protein S18 acetylase RimI-like enzyme/Mn-dependent DtxR family transcriptional regulator
MDLINRVGLLAFGSRLKMILDELYRDISRVYTSNNLDFEARFFLIFYLLKEGQKIKITDIAKEIGQSQPAISQLTDILQEKELINIIKDKNDTRIKLVSLSAKGKKLIPALEEIWENILSAHEDFFKELGIDILNILDKIENGLLRKSMFDRIDDKAKLRAINNVEIIDYSLLFKAYFKDLNYQWLKKHFKVDKKDEDIFKHPEKHIIESGGFILFSRIDGFICGTIAMIKRKKNIYELKMMSVSEKYQGRQIGKKLAIEAIEKAKVRGAKKIFLETDRELTEEIRLYRKLGFEEIEKSSSSKSKTERYILTMELNLYEK